MIWSTRLRRFACVISLLLTGTLLGSGLAFLSQIALARALDLAEFGRMSALLATVNLLTPVATVGVNWFVLRVFGAEGWNAVRWLRPAAWLVGLATSVSCVALGLYVGTSSPHPAELTVILPASILILFGQIAVELGSSTYQLEDRYTALTVWQVATQVGRFVIVIIAATFSTVTVLHIIAGYGLLGLVLSAIGARSVRSLWHGARQRAGTQLHAPPPLVRTFLQAGPCALITIFTLLYFQGTVVIIAWLAGSAAAAEYNAAFLIFTALSMIPTVIYIKFLAAKLCRWAENDRPMFIAAFHVGVPAMALCGTMLALTLITTAHWLIPLLFGAKYANAATLVVIRAVAIPIGFTQMTYSSVFISKAETDRKIIYLGTTAAISLALNVILVPTLGIAGGALTSTIAEAVLLLLHVNGAARHIPGIDVRATFRRSTLVGSAHRLLWPDHVPVSTRI